MSSSLSVSVIFDAIAPAYASDSDKDTFITLATCQTSSCQFGDSYNYAIALRAAHMITMRDRQGISGPISNLREGDLTIYYGSILDTWKHNLHQTSYGTQLLGLIRSHVMKHSVTGTGTLPC